MARIDTLNHFLTDVADSIREKKGTSGQILAKNFDTEIASISGGGDNPLYKVAVFADQHTTKPTADTDWIAFCNLAKAERTLAIVGCGDLSADGDDGELNTWKTLRDNNRGTIPCYTCSGNHESKSNDGYMKYHPELMRQYLDSDADDTSGQLNYFSKTIGNEIYAFVPIFEGVSEHKSQTMFSADCISWLHNLLETHRNERVYVFTHIPADYHYLPKNFGGVEEYQTYKGDYEWGYPTGDSSDRTQFLALMKHYKNAVWLSGHTHVSYHEALENSNPNYVHARYDSDGANMIHMPSVTIPSTIDDGSFNANITAKSECAIMSVYEDHIVLTYHDMIANKTHNFYVDTTLVNIPAEGGTKTLSSISATKTKTNYYTDESFSTADVVVTAHYSDSSTAVVTSSATIGTVDITSAGTKSLSISYSEGGVTKTTIITITAEVRPSVKTLSSIVASVTNTSVEQNQTYVPQGLSVTAYYSDDTNADVTSSASVGTIDTSSAGNKTLTVSYTEDGVTKTYNITIEVVAPVVLSSITAVLTGTYTTDNSISDVTSHITTTAHYSDDTTATVTGTYDTSSVTMSTAGTYSIGVSYTEDGVTKTTTVSLTVNEPAPQIQLYYKYGKTVTVSAEGTLTNSSKGYKVIVGQNTDTSAPSAAGSDWAVYGLPKGNLSRVSYIGTGAHIESVVYYSGSRWYNATVSNNVYDLPSTTEYFLIIIRTNDDSTASNMKTEIESSIVLG